MNYDFDEIVDGFLEFIYDDRTWTAEDFAGLQEILDFDYVYRRSLVDKNVTLLDLERELQINK